jgi:hypothetical protein
MVFSIFLLSIFFGKTKNSLINLIYTAILTTIFTSIWWVPQLVIHKFEPLFAAMKTGFYTFWFWLPLVNFEFTKEFGLKIFSLLGFLGILYLIIKKDYFLLIWFVASFVIQPRSGLRTAIIPFCLIISYGLDKIFLPKIFDIEGGSTLIDNVTNHEFGIIANYFRGKMTRVVFVSIIFYGIYAGVGSMYQNLPSSLVVSEQNQSAMTWVDNNLDSATSVLIITDHDGWSVDGVSEWFPYLANRKSVLTVQGSEWLPNGQFISYWKWSDDIKECAIQGIQCIDDWQNNSGLTYTHVYLNLESIREGQDFIFFENVLSASLAKSVQYREVYREGEVVIFEYLAE